jgi:hypothetical protein
MLTRTYSAEPAFSGSERGGFLNRSMIPLSVGGSWRGIESASSASALADNRDDDALGEELLSSGFRSAVGGSLHLDQSVNVRRA